MKNATAAKGSYY